MMAWDQIARDWAKGALDDPEFAELLRERKSAMLRQSIAAGGLDTVTSATKNAVSMGKQVGLSAPETLAALTRAVEWLDLGYISSRSRGMARF